ncbi:DUF2683 family protein [Dyadobacter sp. 50-39]|uniref:DUF2683 family protein n=1 Tax=Dyadobacter sp. 50-39 TaxID=1895756 RepID=UPI000A6A29F7|nr:hypothetical protein [Dyadobacter sp. 50-39]
MNIQNFTRSKSAYSDAFAQKIKEARDSKSKGELITINPENVWESIESGSEQQRPDV